MPDMMQKLSPHFTLGECLKSATADANGFTEQYTPGADVIANMTRHCNDVLEPLRAAISEDRGVDTPIIITSFYRCARVNGAIPGAAIHSQHQDGLAADTHVQGMTIEEWYQFIRRHCRLNPNFKFGQLIQEFNNWAHISSDPVGNARKMCLRATSIAGVTKYTADPL